MSCSIYYLALRMQCGAPYLAKVRRNSEADLCTLSSLDTLANPSRGLLWNYSASCTSGAKLDA